MIKKFLNQYKSYIISIIIALIVGGLSALLTMNNMDLFDIIKKPPLTPPAIVFPIVWTILYVLMGISAARIYEERHLESEKVRSALTTYASSLVVNFAWSIIFFNWQAFWIAFLWILLLEALVIITIFKYSKIDKTAAYLQIPYAVWVALATYLCTAIAIIN